MESRWFLYPGQTLENTKIEDRGHALHITSDAYENLKRHLTRNKEAQEKLEKEQRKRRHMAEGNRDMIKNWENSLENITKRKEAERIRRLEAIKEDKIQRFFNIRKEQAVVRKEYVEKVRKGMFRSTGISRDLATAFRLTEVLHEREKQKEFKNFLEGHEAEVEAEYAKSVEKNALAEAEEKKEYKKKLHENKKEYGKYLKAVITENAANAQKTRETSKQKEIKDNLRALEEMDIIKRKEQETALEKKKEMKRGLENHMDAERKRNLQLEQEEKEKDEVVAIYQEAKHRINCLRKDKEKELQDRIIARIDAVAKIVGAAEEEKIAREERQLKNAIAERDAMDEWKRKEEEKYQAKLQREQKEERERYILREKEAQKKATEIKKWEMLNRYKNDEVMKSYDLNRKKEEWNKILQYRKELLDQMEEHEKERLRDKEIYDFNAQKCYDGEDAQFFDYADEVLELAKKTGRSTYPIEKVIMDYKQINRVKVPVCKQICCEDYFTEQKPSRSREIANITKQRTCKCNYPK